MFTKLHKKIGIRDGIFLFFFYDNCISYNYHILSTYINISNLRALKILFLIIQNIFYLRNTKISSHFFLHKMTVHILQKEPIFSICDLLKENRIEMSVFQITDIQIQIRIRFEFKIYIVLFDQKKDFSYFNGHLLKGKQFLNLRHDNHFFIKTL